MKLGIPLDINKVKKLTIEARRNKAEKEINAINKEIAEAATKGLWSLLWKDAISEENRNKLLESGYKIEEIGLVTIISWE